MITKLKIIFIIFTLCLIIPPLSHSDSRLIPDFFNAKITLSNAPKITQTATITLDLTAIEGDCEKTTIKFRVPEGVSMLGQSVFEEASFARGESRTYSVEIKALKEGTYALQASVYFHLSDGHTDVEHFFKFLTVDRHSSRISDKTGLLSKNAVEAHTNISLAPSNLALAQDTFTLYGRVTYYDDNHSRPLPIRNVAIKLFDLEGNTSNLIGTQYTDNDGNYTFSNIPNSPDKVFRLVVSFENEALKMMDNDRNLYEFNLPLISNVFGDSVNSDCFFNETNQHRILGHIFNTIMDAYDFLQTNVSWGRNVINVQYPYESEKSLSKYSYSHLYPLRDQIFNELIQIASNRPWDRTAMLHEYGHSVMMALYGYSYNNYPKSSFSGDPDANYTHSVYTASDDAFAIKEGWAEFFEAIVDENAFNTTQYSNVNTPNIEYNSWWKFIGGANSEGNIVEGAVASILWDISDTATSNDEKPDIDDDRIDGRFVELWNIMMNYKPANIRKIWDAWLELGYGQIPSLYSIFSDNGVKVSMPYDLNSDGKIDVADMVMVGSYFGRDVTESIQPSPDINNDGKVDIIDVLIIGKKMAQ